MIQERFIGLIAEDVNVRPDQVIAAVSLFDKGATVPYVARYRKDETGDLSENKLERIAERNDYFTALITRRDALLDNIEKQGKLTDDVRSVFETCEDHLRLEDLSLPFKKQRNNRAAIAANKGLLPLADYIWAQSPTSPPPEVYASSFVLPEKQVLSEEEALEGARHILAECIAMNTEIRRQVRQCLIEQGHLAVNTTKTQAEKAARYNAFSDFSEPLQSVPEDKLLLILRGERDAVLRVELVIDDEALIDTITKRFVREPESIYEKEIRASVADAYRRLLRPAIEAEVFAMARRKADDVMIHACRDHVRNLLLSLPAGPVPIIGMCTWFAKKRSIAVVEKTGEVISTCIIEDDNEEQLEQKTAAALLDLVRTSKPVGIAVSSGPGGRELLRTVQEVLRKNHEDSVFATLVQDVGLPAYVNSPLAAVELPGMDEAARAAVSLARRLQDPLLELVKVEPGFLAAGRMVSGISRKRLQAGIARTIESVVNRIGVDVNTAPVAMLRYVSGLQVGVAQAIVEEREKRNGFTNRVQLLEVSGIGEKTYQQCAGFLRIMNGENLLDGSAIHPEAYPVIVRIAESLGVTVEELAASPDRIITLPLNDFATDTVGPLTLEDIRYELGRIGRDPRRRFRPPACFVSLETIDDLRSGMVIEGIITNITDFGVFVNIGLAQEGLVHRSEMGRTILNDPKKALLVGDVVKVLVLQVEKEAQKVSLSIKGAVKLPLTRPESPRRDIRKEHADTESREEGRQGSWGRGRDNDRERQDRSQGDKRTQRRKGGKGAMAVPKLPKSSSKKGDDALLNTSLAEQLAALREKIVSDGK
jgi:protein Tex